MWHDFFVSLWLKLFGTVELGGVNIGFWFSMLICIILVVVMNLVFWLIKPKKTEDLHDGIEHGNAENKESKQNGK